MIIIITPQTSIDNRLQKLLPWGMQKIQLEDLIEKETFELKTSTKKYA